MGESVVRVSGPAVADGPHLCASRACLRGPRVYHGLIGSSSFNVHPSSPRPRGNSVPLRETTFIDRNLDAWRRLEAELARERPDPDVLRDLYAAVGDDLSYARTHYPNRSVRSYLNHRASALALSLYRNRREGTGVWRFFLRTVPLEIYTQRRPLLLACALFLLSFGIGWGSAVVDPAFAELILGPDYVEMTERNIAAGDPMAVYKDGSMLGGTLGIAGNNLLVSMILFITGILAGIGTLFVLLRNGVMVGTFQEFFFAREVGWESVLGIWTHGTIEITCIVVAAGAGFVLARGIIAPGTLSRVRAFQLTALSGLRIMAGIAPLIVLAAVIEGFLTRMTDVPTPLRIGFLGVNLAFCAFYFVVRPLQVGRGVERDVDDYGTLPPDRPLDWSEFEERTPAQTFFETLRYFSGAGLGLVAACIPLGVVAGAAWMLLHASGPRLATYYDDNGFGPDISNLVEGLTPESAVVVFAVLIIGLTALTYRAHAALPGGVAAAGRRASLLTHLALAVPYVVLFGAACVHVLLLLVTLPVAALWMRGVTLRGGDLLAGFSQAVGTGLRQVGGLLLLAGMVLGAGAVIGLVSDFLWQGFGVPFLLYNTPPGWSDHFDVYHSLRVGSDLAIVGALALLWAQSSGLLYHGLRERQTAAGLELRLEKALQA